jgi:hypothetical protein
MKSTALKFDLEWIVADLEPHLISQVVSQPDVVIPGQDHHLDTPLNECIEFEDDARPCRRNTGSILEPEVEQVSHNEQLAAGLSDMAKKTDQGILMLFCIPLPVWNTQVNIRDEVNTVGH